MDGWGMDVCVSFRCVWSMDGWGGGMDVCVSLVLGGGGGCGYEMVENMCCGDVCSGTKRR